ncbi:hypothetical protein Hanom_Chr06g00558931 [Helianthus anomalus]
MKNKTAKIIIMNRTAGLILPPEDDDDDNDDCWYPTTPSSLTFVCSRNNLSCTNIIEQTDLLCSTL